mgnify:CR=1 FL=1
MDINTPLWGVRVQAPFGAVGIGTARCFPVFPKVDTPYGQAPVGLEGSGAFRRPGSIVRVLRTERWVRPTERAGSGGSLKCRLRRQENHTTALTGEEMQSPLWWLAPPPCPVGSMSLDSRVAYSSPMNPVPLPPPLRGGTIKLRYAVSCL